MAQNYGQVVSSLRSSFRSGKTQGIEWRRSQLKAMIRMVEEESKAMQQALYEDLHKPTFESTGMEINACRNDAIKFLDDLEEWMAPEKVKKDLLTMGDDCYIRHEPLGVVLIMGAWNYPIQLTLIPVLGAIAAGNCVVIKPSEVSAATAKVLEDLIPKYFDKECITVVNGGIPETTALLKERFDYIMYTGSTPVGKIVMEAAAKHLTPVTLELGGKSPVYVDESSDLEIAANRIMWGKLINSGQTCVAPDYVLCTKNVQDKLVKKFKEAITKFYGENPKESADMCRIVNERHFERVKKLLEGGGTVAVGGNFDKTDKYIAPTILTDVKGSDAIMQDEIFGPILPMMPVSGVDEAIQFMADREKPLALYIFTKNKSVSDKIIGNVSSGGLCVNDTIMHMASLDSLPFGGVGSSGMGAYHGKFSFDTFSHKRSIMVKAQAMEVMNGLRYPPYSQKKMEWIEWIMRKNPKAKGLARYFPIMALGVVLAFVLKMVGLEQYLPKSIGN